MVSNQNDLMASPGKEVQVAAHVYAVWIANVAQSQILILPGEPSPAFISAKNCEHK
jgi:hypothetical protein